MPGQLHVVATPIGNLEDISPRALRVLREADLIAAEDTRHTGHLLTRFEIRKPLVSYHQFSEAKRTAEFLLHFGCLVPLAWVFGILLGWGINGVWIAAVVYILLLSTIMSWKFQKGEWRRIRL